MRKIDKNIMEEEFKRKNNNFFSQERDMFGNIINDKKTVSINIYADESMDRKDEYGYNWHYMCLIFERMDNLLLPDIIQKRFLDNNNEKSSYYDKNNRKLHWTTLKDIDSKNICKRWFEYILDINKSEKKFFCYILGLNESFLDDDEFDKTDKFNSIYNRFFRSAIQYSLKCFYPNMKIIVENIYHEQGIQQNHKYFSWQPINWLSKKETNIIFKNNRIEFLEKDHNKNDKANILQLSDCFMGAILNLLHGLPNYNSNGAKQKLELLNMILPLLVKMIEEPNNPNSKYNHSNRIMIRFFPNKKTDKNSLERKTKKFYTYRNIRYIDDINGQETLFKV
ncbi:MAG: hypothetical protein KA059_02245 [Elusimicrobiales bacterium]|nr:hypothetical protein [Elusimicrobiales bacterium]